MARSSKSKKLVPVGKPVQRHMSCEGCRKRKAKCSRTFPCAGCTMRDAECIWTSKPLQRKLGTPGPISLYENKLEIARLKKVVHQLETIISERDAEQAAYRALLPAPPPRLENPSYPSTSTPTFDEFQEAENYFNLFNPELPIPLPYDSTSASLPQSYTSAPYSSTPQPLQQPNKHYPHTPSRPGWLLHSRASTWPSSVQPVNPYHLPDPPLNTLPPFAPFDGSQLPSDGSPIKLPPFHSDHFSLAGGGGQIGGSSQSLELSGTTAEYDPHHPQPLEGDWSAVRSFEAAQITV
ncbi:hypothetical protein JCM5353_004215 [Sporobolomyces roseus]